MNVPNKIHILKLYKDLLRYGQQLKYTDKNYFFRRIKKEFRENKTIENSEDITFNFNKGNALLEKRSVK